MLEGIIGKKLGMTQIFTEAGDWTPVTVIEAGPCMILQIKTEKKDGYNALRLGFGGRKANRVSKPEWGAYAKHCLPEGERQQPVGRKKEAVPEVPLQMVREVRVDNVEEFQEGQTVGLDIFKVGEYVDVVGRSKGKGFTGVVKRHGFHGGEVSHGSMFHRAPGSIGASAYPSRVMRGKKMPGHMGNRRVTVIKLQIVDIRPRENLILVRGAVPGPNNGYVMIRKSKREQRI